MSGSGRHRRRLKTKLLHRDGFHIQSEEGQAHIFAKCHWCKDTFLAPALTINRAIDSLVLSCFTCSDIQKKGVRPSNV